MKYRVRHTTIYRYSEAVAVSHNVVHLAPFDGPGQRCLHHELTVGPAPAVAHERRDYFGNRISAFTVQDHHRELTVRAVSEVEVQPSPSVPANGPAWDEVRDRLARGAEPAWLGAMEFLYDSPLVPLDAALAAYAAPSFPPGRPLTQALLDLNGRIHRDFTYDTTATSIATPLAEVLARRRGVCQDFAQVLIGCLRSVGLAAHYVSGYLDTRRSADDRRLIGADASHAWVAAFCPGADRHWLHLDPTNDSVPSDRHLIVAFGRDFSDVSPVKGVILGGGSNTVTVGVEVARMGAG